MLGRKLNTHTRIDGYLHRALLHASIERWKHLSFDRPRGAILGPLKICSCRSLMGEDVEPPLLYV